MAKPKVYMFSRHSIPVFMLGIGVDRKILKQSFQPVSLVEVRYSSLHLSKEGRSKSGIRHVMTTLKSVIG